MSDEQHQGECPSCGRALVKRFSNFVCVEPLCLRFWLRGDL